MRDRVSPGATETCGPHDDWASAGPTSNGTAKAVASKADAPSILKLLNMELYSGFLVLSQVLTESGGDPIARQRSLKGERAYEPRLLN